MHEETEEFTPIAYTVTELGILVTVRRHSGRSTGVNDVTVRIYHRQLEAIQRSVEEFRIKQAAHDAKRPEVTL